METFRIQRKRVLAYLVGGCVFFELLLVFLDATVNYSHWSSVSQFRRLFNITREDALASWFGVTQTFMVALTLLLIWAVMRRLQRPRWVVAGWLVLALLFGYMAVDDGAEVHERIGSAFKKTDAGVLDAFPSYPWQIIFVPILIVMGLFIAGFLVTQLRDLRSRIFVCVALACFSLAVGCDFIEGLDERHPWNLYTHIAESWDIADYSMKQFGKKPFVALRHFSKSVEEFLEMLGMTIFWAIFLSHFMKEVDGLRIEFRD